MQNFVAELRRRNVLRVAATYALVAWIIIEAGSVLLPTFGAPEGAFQIYVIAVIAGFAISVIMAWVFEVTPDGVKLDRDVDPQRRRGSPERRQRMNMVIIGLLVVALAVSITLNLTGLRGAEAYAERNSIAVLPFNSRTADEEHAGLADSIHYELLTRLANNSSLKVISTTSVAQYRNSSKGAKEIGSELDVDTILEGDVQQIGDTVRITVTLIDAVDDVTLWAEQYTKQVTLRDIFALQSEISASIEQELSAALAPEDQGRLSQIPTDNLVAYNRYATALRNMALRQMPEAQIARDQFAEAIALDPEFAEAHSGLATSILLLYINFQGIVRDDAFRLATESIERALELKPDLADAYAARGLMYSTRWQEERTGNYAALAEQAFTRALQLNPNHASAYMWYASIQESLENYAEASRLYERSIELDPLGRIPYISLPTLYAAQGRSDDATRSLLRAIELHPDWPTPYQYMAIHLNGLGYADEAMAWFRKANDLIGDSAMTGNALVGIYIELGEQERAMQEMAALPPNHPLSDLTPSLNLLFAGDMTGTLSALLDAVNRQPARPPFVYDIISNVAILADDMETAEKYLYLHQPALAADNEMPINRNTVRSVVRLAYILQKRGEATQAYEILRQALPVVQSMPRLGFSGHGILDVQILALMGRDEDALDTLEGAVADGFRSSITYDFWPLDGDPYLARFADNPRFIDVREIIISDFARMRDNVLEAEATDDWQSLREHVYDRAAATVIAGAAQPRL